MAFSNNGFFRSDDSNTKSSNPLFHRDDSFLEEGMRDDKFNEVKEDQSVLQRAKSYYNGMGKFQKLGLFALLGAIAGIIGIFTIGPVVGQSALDGSTMSFKSITITEPKQVDANTHTMKVTAVTSIGNDFFLGAKLEEFKVDISYDGEVMGSMTLPALNIGGSTTTEIELKDLDFEVTNTALFDKMNQDLVERDSVDWKVEGKTGLTALVGSVPATPNFGGLSLSKITAIKGLGGVGTPDKLILETDTVNLPSNYEADGVTGLTLFVTSVLKNPSIVSLPLGNIEFEMSWEGHTIGRAKAQDVVLLRGDNRIPLQGYMSIADQTVASDFFSKYMAGEALSLTVRGVAVDGAPAVWIETLVKSLELHPVLNGLTDYSVVTKMDMTQMNVEFSSSETEVGTSAAIFAAYQIPFAFPLDILELNLDLSLLYNDQEFGTLAANALVPRIPCGYPVEQEASPRNVKMGQMNLTMPLSTLQVTNKVGFETFTKALISSPGSVQIRTRGSTKALTKSILGEFYISNLKVDALATLYAMQNFNAPNNIGLTNINITQANTASELSLTLDVEIRNPSSLVGSLGETTLDVYWDHPAASSLLRCNSLPSVNGGKCLTKTSSFPSWGVNIHNWTFTAGLTKVGRAIVQPLTLTRSRQPTVNSAVYPSPGCAANSVGPEYPNYANAAAGSNTYKLTGFIFEKSSGEVGTAFLSTYLQGTSMNLTLKGDRSASSAFASTLPLLKESLKALEAKTPLPGLPADKFLMKKVTLVNPLVTILSGYVMSKVIIDNPFDTDMLVSTTLFNVYTSADNKYVGYTTEVPSEQVTFTIPANMKGFESPQMKVYSGLGNSGSTSALSNPLVLEGTMKVKIGTSFETTLSFHQAGIPTA